MTRLYTRDAASEVRELVRGAKLSAIPEEIYRRSEITVLDYQHNQITEISSRIANMVSLQELNLAGNRLSRVPEAVGDLTGLRVLDLSHNRLEEVPAALGKLDKLEVLNLSFNNISTLPAALGNLRGDVLLILDSNPLIEPLNGIAAVGTPEVLTYLKSLQQAVPTYEAKLLLVGEGNVGKSSLIAALRQEPFVQGRSTTHGIETDNLLLKHPDEPLDITLHTWDFGGQEVYRISHQFFFSKQAIFLVVWRPREGQEENAVAEWCERIRLRVGEDAKILIVATYGSEGRRIELDWPALKDEFGTMLLDQIQVDNKTGLGIPRLRKLIAEAAAQLPQMGTPSPPTWLTAREEILSLDKPEVSFEAFEATCSAHELHAAETRLLAISMNELGYIIYFADDDALSDVVILQPEWLTRAISLVLEDEETAQSGGLLEHDRLPTIWGAPTIGAAYEARYFPYFLRLMERFDVSYRVQDADLSLVGQLVPYESPFLPWRPGTPLRYGLREIAVRVSMNREPPGLVAWLTVRNHLYSTGKHWRRGVFLGYPQYGSEALLEIQRRELSLVVRAPSPDFFFHHLLGTVEALIGLRWPGLQYDLLIPCPTAGCTGTFPLRALMRMREQGEFNSRCHVCIEPISVTRLLTGFPLESGDVASIIERIETSEREIVRRMDKASQSITEEIRYTQAIAANAALGIRAVLKSLAEEVNDCPRLFSVQRRKRWFDAGAPTRVYRIQLWCEEPGAEHPCAGEPYEYIATKEWIQKVAPYLKLTAKIVGSLIPMASGAADLLSSDDQGEILKDSLGLAEPIVENVETLSTETELHTPLQFGEAAETLTRAEVEGLRQFRMLLFRLDSQRKFGGLRRVLTPVGDYLWVCGDHYRLYNPGLPTIPTTPPAIDR